MRKENIYTVESTKRVKFESKFIEGIEIGVISDVAEEIMRRFKDLPDKDLKLQETGGFLAILKATSRDYIIPLVIEVADCAPSLEIQTQELVQENCRRLLKFRNEKGHITSWQSRNPEDKEYGGGITIGHYWTQVDYGGNLFGAFSGLPEHQNEALVTILFLTFNWISSGHIEKIIEISNNQFIRPLCQACDDILKIDYRA